MDNGALPEPDSAPCAPEADRLDWDELRRLSLRPGGFGEQRIALWAQILNVDTSSLPSKVPVVANEELVDTPGEQTDTHAPPANGDIVPHPHTNGEAAPHPDERQVRLDTDRSFVLYPVGDMKDRESRQGGLHELIVSVLRKRRRLSYFQGYHDIVSVLFLTLPKELQFLCVEKLSLHRVRDSMGASLEPVVGLLRVLKRVLAQADPEFAARLSHHTPLPYYSLSNLLTLFSHDIPTLPLIQHVFDYLLSRPPIIVVYLAAAVILTRKSEVHILEQEGEEGMIHSLLSGLPELFEENEEEEKTLSDAEMPTGTDPEKVNPQSGNQSSKNEEGQEEQEPPEKPAESLSPGSDRSAVPEADLDEKHVKMDLEEAESELVPNRSSDTEVPEQQHSHGLEPSDATADSFHTASEKTDPLREEEKPAAQTRRRSSSASEGRVRKPRISITWLLERSDELYHLHPPSGPAVNLSRIMGPQSVMCTWSEKPSELPTDDEAELMVTQPQLIVLPLQPEEIEQETKEEAESEREREKTRKRRRRRLHKPRRIGPVVLERKAVVASAVLVLGVAMAIYGLQTAPERHHGGARYELKRLSRLFGGFVVGAGERLWEGLVAMSQ